MHMYLPLSSLSLSPSLSLLSFTLSHSLSSTPPLLPTTKYQNYRLSLLLCKHNRYNVMHVHVHITCTYACTCMYTSMSFTCGDTDNYRTHAVHVTTTCISFPPSLPPLATPVRHEERPAKNQQLRLTFHKTYDILSEI